MNHQCKKCYDTGLYQIPNGPDDFDWEVCSCGKTDMNEKKRNNTKTLKREHGVEVWTKRQGNVDDKTAHHLIMENTQSIYQKIFEVQKKIGVIKKELDNPYYKSKYFDINIVLEELKPLLREQNLLLIQPLTHLDDIVTLTTIVVDCDSGKKLEFSTILPSYLTITINEKTGDKKEFEDAQKAGSIITYFRRYAITSLFALQGEEDDDGNSASITSTKDTPNTNVPFDKYSRTISIVNLTEQNGKVKPTGRPFTRYIVELADGRKPGFFDPLLKVKAMKLPKNTPIDLDDPKIDIDIVQEGQYWNVVDKIPTVQEDMPTEDSEVLCNTCGFEIFKECKYQGHHPK